ncbi:MAG TPA: flippase activity-associated protein Agl23 [Xanthomonadales bacterium]|nr:flippase activity-associated protein Agl23 [Xanthomonadales bacterium]
MPPADDTRWRVAFWLAIAAGLALRLCGLDWRPLHHDEAVNWWFAGRWAAGEFRYDPGNYHGPLLFWIAAWLRPLADLGEWGLRLPIALASGALPLALLPLRRLLGWRALALAGALLTVATTLLWVGRYFIHETLLVAATLVAATCFARAYALRDARAWVACAIAIAVMFALKETTIATLAAFAAGLAAAASPAWRNGTSIAALAMAAWPGWRVAAIGIACAIALLVAAYTSGFTNAEGIVDFARAFALWSHTGAHGAGHEKPWWYHAMLLGRYEPGLLLLAASAWPRLRRGDPWAWFCAAWFLALLAAYSVTPYKTPWLIVNVTLPLALLAALAMDEWLVRAPRIAQLALGVALALQLPLAVRLSFVHYTDAREPMVYMQHTDAVRELARQVLAESERRGGVAVLIQTGESWPLPYYLRTARKVSYATAPFPEANQPIVLVDTRFGDVPPREPARYTRTQVDVRPNQAYVLWIRRD